MRAEDRAQINLERQGFETYLPRYQRERRHARRRELVKAPLFPGYVFVRFDLDTARWRSINGTFGVNHLICYGDRPAAVPEGVVEEIVARMDESGLIALEPRPFHQGEALQIVSGSLSNCRGLFERMADKNRVILLLSLLGRQVRVQAPLNVVAAGA
ncbi:transcription termination/antitermination protein NusG [Pelagibius sp.]|uniref:transcription termination/antitermination protein NusG n=1 Tax=Pelagibius sp. TaxID=1931238 RepID=UPI003BA8A52C